MLCCLWERSRSFTFNVTGRSEEGPRRTPQGREWRGDQRVTDVGLTCVPRIHSHLVVIRAGSV